MKKIVFALGLLFTCISISAQTNTFPTSGSVGIGTTSPSQKLDVRGVIQSGPTSTNGGIFLAQRYSGVNHIGTLSSNHSNGNLIIGYGAAGKYGSGSSTLVSTFENFNGYRSAVRIGSGTFEILNTPTAVQVPIGDELSMSSRFFVDRNGNIGLGTKSPQTKLHLYNQIDGAFNGLVIDNRKIYGVGTGTNETSRISLSLSENGVANPLSRIFGMIEAGTEMEASSIDGRLSFYVRDATVVREKMRITSNGYVGIGITNPESVLDVKGAGILRAQDNAAGLALHVRNSIGTNSFTLRAFSDRGEIKAQNGQHLNINDYSGNSWLYGQNGGRVGVGTTSPQSKLHIAGDLIVKDGIRFEDTGEKIEYYGDADHSAHVQLYNPANGNIEIKNVWNGGNADIILNPDHNVIVSQGNVGIGTTSPSHKLTVAGDVNIGGTGNSSLRVRHVNGKDFDSNGFDHLYLNYSTDKNVWIGSPTNPSSLIANGKVAVGTTSVPGDYQMAIAGKVIAEEVRVELQSSWPDYVFKKDYKLLSVEEVENYIKKHGHLPEMPSAKEVEKEGVLLGEMNKKLLEKVEELTLYTISQEKEIKKLLKQEERIQKIEEENKQLKDLLARVAKLENKSKK